MTIAIVYFTLHVYLCVSISISKFIHMYYKDYSHYTELFDSHLTKSHCLKFDFLRSLL